MAHKHKRTRIGFDDSNAVIDDHCRLAYAEIHDDENGTTTAGVLLRAVDIFARNGISRIERVISDKAFAQLGAEQRFIKPHCPWTNGKVERVNRTLTTGR
ncbi:transposase [Cryobacterium sinapicolor]|uniref:Transposase n=1 Tax=Cryobacterium sinapicolor TaxID=1259236 RepID=A0ABY2IZQ0_9MICO|nr:transposase [Cryobacterium sinapicolor]